MTSIFNAYRLEDAKITKLVIEDSVARLSVHNWRDEIHILVFHNLAGIECLNFLNVDLSHGEELIEEAFLQRCHALVNERTDKLQCFQFFSAWSESPILKIVASFLTVIETNSEPTI
jgi:hypothetical protein